jgi:hypothetical protein
MVKLSKVERDALDELFAGLHTDRLTLLERVVRFFKRLI